MEDVGLVDESLLQLYIVDPENIEEKNAEHTDVEDSEEEEL